MNKPITSAIAAACALCAAAAPVAAKTRGVVPLPPQPRQIVETVDGFVINERIAAVLTDKAAPLVIPVGVSVRLDVSLMGGKNGETGDARR